MRSLVNGQSAKSISLSDRGFLYGDGVFTTLRIYEGIPFRLREHLERLCDAASSIDLPVDGLARRLQEDITSLELEPVGILRIALTGGEGAGLLRPSGEPTRIVSTAPLALDVPKPVNVTTEQPFIASPLGIKSMSYALSLDLRRRAATRGAFEAIACDHQGVILEGSRTNIFLVTDDGEVVTPSLNGCILPGITRRTVLELGATLGVRMTERVVRAEEVRKAVAAFLTSSLMELVPIAIWDERVLDAQHPLILRLKNAYSDLVASEIEHAANCT